MDTGKIACVAMAFVLTGCHFGNYSSSAQSPDPVTGYYDANPVSLQFCATGSASTCVQASTTQIPAFIADEVSNPVALILQDAQTGSAFLTAFGGQGQKALPIWVGTDNTTLYYANSTPAQTLWKSSACTTVLYLQEDGMVVPGASRAIPNSKSATQGALTLKIQVVRTFDGANGGCAAELQAMSDCYQDVTRCGGADSGDNEQLQTGVRNLFSAYIQAGAMAASDIPNLVNIAYEAHYQ